MWVLIDNYDSFTYILHHYLLQTGNECVVYRNDQISVSELKSLNPDRIILSPGPETPIQAGITMSVIDQFHATTPILGICLGHQALGMYFGAKLIHALAPMHGKISVIRHNQHPLFNSIPDPFNAMRYHSLVVSNFKETELDCIANAEDGTIMALAHRRHHCTGIQFHPESVGTDYGLQMIRNWAAIPIK